MSRAAQFDRIRVVGKRPSATLQQDGQRVQSPQRRGQVTGARFVCVTVLACGLINSATGKPHACLRTEVTHGSHGCMQQNAGRHSFCRGHRCQQRRPGAVEGSTAPHAARRQRRKWCMPCTWPAAAGPWASAPAGRSRRAMCAPLGCNMHTHKPHTRACCHWLLPSPRLYTATVALALSSPASSHLQPLHLAALPAPPLSQHQAALERAAAQRQCKHPPLACRCLA
jgi:hypothetical protein